MCVCPGRDCVSFQTSCQLKVIDGKGGLILEYHLECEVQEAVLAPSEDPVLVLGSRQLEVMPECGQRSGVKKCFKSPEFKAKDCLSVLKLSLKQTPGLGGRKSAEQEGRGV